MANCSPGPYDRKEVRFTQHFAVRVAGWPSRRQVKLNAMHNFISLSFFQSKRQIIWQNFVILCDRRRRGNVSRMQDQLLECRISYKIPGIHYCLWLLRCRCGYKLDSFHGNVNHVIWCLEFPVFKSFKLLVFHDEHFSNCVYTLSMPFFFFFYE